jgi:predicted transcriptional regulator
MSRYIHLSIYDEDKIDKILVALSSKVRREILRLVDQSSYNVVEVAQKLDIPVSTAAFHIKNLQDAELINIQIKPGQRGTSKIISRKIDEININCFAPSGITEVASTNINIPIGSYNDCCVTASCGMASEDSYVGFDDTPGLFFDPERIHAQIIWFTTGYLEYRIPNYFMKKVTPIALSFSLEICSEAPNYRNDWKSDITFWVNGTEVCTWTSPGDLGGRRGRLNPSWWSELSTQYGLLKTIRINRDGTYLDENRVSAVGIVDLNIHEGDYFTLRIGIKPDAKNLGGINLFGEKFGDYQQNIMLRLDYKAN